ncbi:MAG: bifunctional diaminohydroxyphosphoribosylaminopyrimidine deaminase/5-amino-6-(5-phosphoribosylamino)uracil reductase RibD [Ignavibacteriales bacterium]|nr:bifunctional diaminohydroxyphosphoribosylaminopyrimidine deaminase/5-amino-6-(5-phosphoribosylamino)uracil reductase RibD [Ignavibacteriales bacterium]
MDKKILKDQLFMLEALSLAQKGAGRVEPNPMVGAVIVKNNRIIGKGYHQYFGGPHAEVNAIANCSESVSGSTIYVNLEPCNYHGKTPPCTDLLIKNKIKRVVVGSLDPNPLVAGKGVAQLRRAGLTVQLNVLKEESERLNEVFRKYIRTKIPFVVIKIAQTLDGKISDSYNRAKWISSNESRKFVHSLRSQYDAILVGANTVKIDNPSLTARIPNGRNPIRVILDGNFSTSLKSRLFNDRKSKTIIIISKSSGLKNKLKVNKFIKAGIEVIQLAEIERGIISTKNILNTLGLLCITSILIEGGSNVITQFIKEKTADKILIFQSPQILGAGLNSVGNLGINNIKNSINLKKISSFQIKDDLLIEGYF